MDFFQFIHRHLASETNKLTINQYCSVAFQRKEIVHEFLNQKGGCIGRPELTRALPLINQHKPRLQRSYHPVNPRQNLGFGGRVIPEYLISFLDLALICPSCCASDFRGGITKRSGSNY
jgi:hypothetical protein